MSLEILVHHPLLAQLAHDNSYFMCRTPLPDAGSYQLSAPVVTEPVKIRRELFHFLVLDKLRQCSIIVHKLQCGIVDVNNKLVIPVDFIGEVGEFPVLVLSYYSENRRGALLNKVRKHGMSLIDLCQKNYNVNPYVAIINVYNEGRAELFYLNKPMPS